MECLRSEDYSQKVERVALRPTRIFENNLYNEYLVQSRNLADRSF